MEPSDPETAPDSLAPLWWSDSARSPFDKLPNELVIAVLGWLPIDGVLTAGFVCRRWRGVLPAVLSGLDTVDLTPFALPPESWVVDRLAQLPAATKVSVPRGSPELLAAIRRHCPLVRHFEVVAPHVGGWDVDEGGRMGMVPAGMMAVAGGQGRPAVDPRLLVNDTLTAAIVTSLPHLTALTLDSPRASIRNAGVSLPAFSALIRGLPELRWLRVAGCLQRAAFPPPLTHAEAQAALLAALAAADGADDFPPPPPPLRFNLETVSLSGVVVNPVDLTSLLETCPGLQSLELCDLVAESLDAVAIDGGTPSLRVLRCEGIQGLMAVRVHNAPMLTEVAVVGCPRLTALTLVAHTLEACTIDGCFALATVDVSSDTLRELDLTHCVGLTTLTAECPELTRLSLRGCTKLRAAGLHNILSRRLLPSLQDLDVTGATLLSLDKLAGLMGPPPSSPLAGVHAASTAGATAPGMGVVEAGSQGPWLQQALPDGLSATAAAAVLRGSAAAADVVGCAVLRAGDVPLRKQVVVGPRLRRLELTKFQNCRDLILDTPCLQVLEISDASRELELDEALATCTALEEIRVVHAIRPFLSLSGTLSALEHLRSVSFVSVVLGSIKLRGSLYLETLHLDTCRETQTVSLQGCHALTSVHVGFCSVRTLVVLDCPLLTSLTVPGCTFDEVTVDAPRLRALEELSVLWGQPPEFGTLAITAGALEVLSVTRSHELHDSHMHKLLGATAALTQLSLSDCGKLTELVLPPTLCSLRLRSLRNLVRVVGSDGGVVNLPSLAHLSLSNMSKLPDAAIEGLIRSAEASLQTLELSLLGNPTEFVIRDLPKLRDLSIEYCNKLQQVSVLCTMLESLTLSGLNLLAEVELLAPLSRVQIKSSPLQQLRQLKVTSEFCPSPAFLADACPKLEGLTLVGVAQADPAELQRLAQYIPTLGTIQLQHSTTAPPEAIRLIPAVFPRYPPPDPQGLDPTVTLTFKEVRTRRTFELTVPATLTVDGLKQWLASRTGLVPREIKLVFGGSPLLDETLLSTAGLGLGGVINLVATRLCVLSRQDVVTVTLLEPC